MSTSPRPRRTQPRESKSMNHRQDDPPLVKVTREIPLPWLVGVITAIIMAAATQYFTQLRQAELIVELTAKVQKLTETLEARTQKDQERDFKLLDIERRLTAQELKSSTTGMKR